VAAEFHPAVYCLTPEAEGSLPAEEAETFHQVEAVTFRPEEAEAANRPGVEVVCHPEEEAVSSRPVVEGCRLEAVRLHRHRGAVAAALFHPVAAEAEHFRRAVAEEVVAEHLEEAEEAARSAPGRFPRQRHHLSRLPRPVRMRRDRSWTAPRHRYPRFRFPIRPFRPSW
jgi:hypothetical protein